MSFYKIYNARLILLQICRTYKAVREGDGAILAPGFKGW